MVNYTIINISNNKSNEIKKVNRIINNNVIELK